MKIPQAVLKKSQRKRSEVVEEEREREKWANYVCAMFGSGNKRKMHTLNQKTALLKKQGPTQDSILKCTTYVSPIPVRGVRY